MVRREDLKLPREFPANSTQQAANRFSQEVSRVCAQLPGRRASGWNATQAIMCGLAAALVVGAFGVWWLSGAGE